MRKIYLIGLIGLFLIAIIGCAKSIAEDENSLEEIERGNEPNEDKQEPSICTMEYAPVCGVDGKTYSNSCQAQDVEIAYQGECSEENAYSEPRICTKEYMPVCGADNVTYSNSCEAGDMAIEHKGVC